MPGLSPEGTPKVHMVSRAAPSEQTQALVLFVPDDPQSQVPELLAVPAFPSNSLQSLQDEPFGLLELPKGVKKKNRPTRVIARAPQKNPRKNS